jgi:hypothetical protein
LTIADYHEAYREGFICFYKTIDFTIEEIKEEIDGKETTRIEKIPKPEDLQFTYRIKEYYVPTSLNNQIFCMVRKGEYQFENFIDMTFGTQGTSGTDYTILVQPTIGQRAVTNSAPLVVDVKAFNYDNEELDIHADTSVGSLKDGSLYNPTVVWRGPSTFDFAIDKTTNTVINSGMISV